ncbi:MAG: hypothetical protein SVP52_08210 [Chloroflexota bacterium]|nr:hypothetical protein [Chloroflexota bacterium]
MQIDNTIPPDEARKGNRDFWGEETTDYMDPSYYAKNPTYEWQRKVSDIINAITGAGLRLEFFNEFSAMDEPAFFFLGFFQEAYLRKSAING